MKVDTIVIARGKMTVAMVHLSSVDRNLVLMVLPAVVKRLATTEVPPIRKLSLWSAGEWVTSRSAVFEIPSMMAYLI